MTLTAADIAQGIAHLADAIHARTAGAPIALAAFLAESFRTYAKCSYAGFDKLSRRKSYRYYS